MSPFHRRQFLIGVAALAASPLPCVAQPKIPVIGLLDAGKRLWWWDAFRQKMSELGHLEGKGIVYEARYAQGNLDRLPDLAGELVRQKVAVIVTAGTAATQAARRATDRIPIVTASGADHVSMGFAASLSHPGGNVTGLTSLSTGLTGKRVELLHEIFPNLSRLAVLWQSDNPTSAVAFRDLENAAQAYKITIQNLGVRKAAEISGAFSGAIRERAEALFVIGGPLTIDEREPISALERKHRLPAMHTSSGYGSAGLVFYGVNADYLFRSAAVYVDRILKGAKAGDLPIEQPTKFELVINLKTAKSLGITVPQSILVRATRVIE